LPRADGAAVPGPEDEAEAAKQKKTKATLIDYLKDNIEKHMEKNFL